MHPIAHVSWSCDGRKLASVGTDKSVRVWTPEKSVSAIQICFSCFRHFQSENFNFIFHVQLEPRTASQYLNGHENEVDYVTWNPAHPDLFCSSSQKDRRVVFWDIRRMYHDFSLRYFRDNCSEVESRHIQYYSHNVSPTQINYSPNGKNLAVVTANHQLSFMEYGSEGGESKGHWTSVRRNPVSELTTSTADFDCVGARFVSNV